MTGKPPRKSVPDRARRRAIRTYAARFGISYSVAARLLMAQAVQQASAETRGFPTAGDEHRAWLFAMRERRPFHQRLHDTRLAADLPLGRAAHLAERFPPLRRPQAVPLYDGEARQATLALLYLVLRHESPALLPGARELAWVADLGEETGVDIACAAIDRAARLLLDGDRWNLCTRFEATLAGCEASPDRSLRDAAIVLGPEFRTLIPRRSFDGPRQILDALLVAGHDGHPPGARVRILAGPARGSGATVTGAHWAQEGPPTHYDVRADTAILTLRAEDVAPPEEKPAHPEPLLTA